MTERERRACGARNEPGGTAVVTGASGAIGRAVAVALADVADHIVLVGRDEGRLLDAADAVRGRRAAATVAPTDLASIEEVGALADVVRQTLGGLDILVHSAGGYDRGDLAEVAVENLDALFRSNVRGPYALTQQLMPALVERQGIVVVVNSTQGLQAKGGVGQYAATQHAMRAVADSLRAEVNSAGVRVTILHIGRTASGLQERIHALEGRAYEREALIQPEDVADLVLAAVSLPKRAQVASMTLWPTRVG